HCADERPLPAAHHAEPNAPAALGVAASLDGHSCFSSNEPERAIDLLLVDCAAGEIVERLVGDPDDVMLDELGALARAVLGVLQTAFPLEHRPGRIAASRELGEDAVEVDLPVAERAEAAGALDPGRVTRIDALPAGRIELGVLYVKRLDPLVIDVDDLEIVELLQHEVRRIVVDRTARVSADRVEEALEGRAVEQVLAGMKLVRHVAAGVVEGVEDWIPALGEFLEGGLDQAGRALRPRIQERPGERAGKGRVRGKAEALRSFRALHHVLDCPFLPLGWLASNVLGRETVESLVIGRVHSDELGRDMTREFGDRKVMGFRGSGQFIAISLRLRRLADVDKAIDPSRNLNAFVAERGRPPAHSVERIERRRFTGELVQKYRRAFDHASHDCKPPYVRRRSLRKENAEL